MPQTGMDWWVIAGVLVAVIGVWIAWRQYRKGRATTHNTIKGGNRNTQQGGFGSTVNQIEDGDDNEQRG
jgi:ABC-type nickel/cobalt efflux system permease component RcnA